MYNETSEGEKNIDFNFSRELASMTRGCCVYIASRDSNRHVSSARPIDEMSAPTGASRRKITPKMSGNTSAPRRDTTKIREQAISWREALIDLGRQSLIGPLGFFLECVHVQDRRRDLQYKTAHLEYNTNAADKSLRTASPKQKMRKGARVSLYRTPDLIMHSNIKVALKEAEQVVTRVLELREAIDPGIGKRPPRKETLIKEYREVIKEYREVISQYKRELPDLRDNVAMRDRSNTTLGATSCLHPWEATARHPEDTLRLLETLVQQHFISVSKSVEKAHSYLGKVKARADAEPPKAYENVMSHAMNGLWISTNKLLHIDDSIKHEYFSNKSSMYKRAFEARNAIKTERSTTDTTLFATMSSYKQPPMKSKRESKR